MSSTVLYFPLYGVSESDTALDTLVKTCDPHLVVNKASDGKQNPSEQ